MMLRRTIAIVALLAAGPAMAQAPGLWTLTTKSDAGVITTTPHMTYADCNAAAHVAVQPLRQFPGHRLVQVRCRVETSRP